MRTEKPQEKNENSMPENILRVLKLMTVKKTSTKLLGGNHQSIKDIYGMIISRIRVFYIMKRI